MSPDLYEDLCTAVEKKFGVTPRFFRSENILGRTAESPPIMMVKTEGGCVFAEVPDTFTEEETDRLIGNLESEFVRQGKWPA